MKAFLVRDKESNPYFVKNLFHVSGPDFLMEFLLSCDLHRGLYNMDACLVGYELISLLNLKNLLKISGAFLFTNLCMKVRTDNKYISFTLKIFKSLKWGVVLSKFLIPHIMQIAVFCSRNIGHMLIFGIFPQFKQQYVK